MKLVKDLGMQYTTSKSKQRARMGIYECGCGVEFRTSVCNVKRGTSTQCKNCRSIKHGGVKTQLYVTWTNMKSRCNYKKSAFYYRYGGRGIMVCDEWMSSFSSFSEWAKMNGHKETLTIDRIDNNGNYEPSNCRWVTRSTQSRNTRRIYANNTSGYRGVYSSGKKWKAQLKIDSSVVYLGQFDSKFTAAIVYDQYVIDNNLEHTTNGKKVKR